MAKITALHPDVLAAVQGLGVDTANAARVVIDIKAGHTVEVHVIGYADERLAAKLGDILDGADVVEASPQGTVHSSTREPAPNPQPIPQEGS